MAVIKLGTTKSANRLISYAEKRAEISSSLNCDYHFAKSQFNATRELFNKNNNIQAHHIIQSFKPNETTKEQANLIGLELTRKLFKDFECVIYTHADKKHIHNHIIVNSVNFENGKKLQLHGKKAIDMVRNGSDELCLKYNLSIVREHNASVRYTLAEKGLFENNKTSWKDEIRQVIDYEIKRVSSYDEFKHNLKSIYNISVDDKGKYIVFTHPDNNKRVRGKTLGADYERGNIENGIIRFNKQQYSERNTNSEREVTRLKQAEQNGVRKQSFKGKFDRIYGAVREVEDGAKQFSERGKIELQQRAQREQEIAQRVLIRNISPIRECRENSEQPSNSERENKPRSRKHYIDFER